VVSEGFRCPACFQKEARKQEQQANAGVLTNIPATRGWPVTEKILDGVAAATFFGIPRTGESTECAAAWWGGCNLSCRGSDRYLESIQSTVFRAHKQFLGYGRQEEDLLSTQWVRLFCDTTEVSGVLGGRLQRRRGHDWLTGQADSGGRLRVKRSGSKWTTQAKVQCSDGDGDVTQQREAGTVMDGDGDGGEV
jgi:hypothetical protein